MLPLRRAHELDRCLLYWIPVNSFPVPVLQKQWLLKFFDTFMELLTTQLGLRIEVFLQYKTVVGMPEQFRKAVQDFPPLIGLSLGPGATLSPLPSKDDIRRDAEVGREFDLRQWTTDYCYWFVKKNQQKQREVFFGHGGLKMILLKPDPATTPPSVSFSPAIRKQKLFEIFDIDGLLAGGAALGDGFLAKSKQLFGAALQNESIYPGIPFIVPLLRSSDFFSQPDDEFAKWFQLFDVYINESPADGGILMASKIDFEQDLIRLLEQMRAEGWVYPEN